MDGATVVPSVSPEANPLHYLHDVENVVTATLHIVFQFIWDAIVVVRLDNVSSEGSKARSTVLLLEVNNFV
jgi:hypothetical protein